MKEDSAALCPDSVFYDWAFMKYTEVDIKYMQRAIALARKGGGFVHPNPLVGCVITKDNAVIAEGFHERYGGWHAERNAINNCETDLCGACLYVTLEPCCHYGKTPPCVDIIIEKGISRVIVGCLDPNALVAGKGIEKLISAGVEVIVGVEEEEVKKLNKVFFKYITSNLPWVAMKYAMTLDGRITSQSRNSKWITNDEARIFVHKLRAEMMSVMVGIGTVNADDPMLNVRLDNAAYQPIRIVVDTKASISEFSNIVKSADKYRTVIAHTELAPSSKLVKLNDWGIETLCCEMVDNQVDIKSMLMELSKKSIDSVLVEGGAKLNTSILEAKCVDEVYAFIAPKIIGSADNLSPVLDLGFDDMKDAIGLKDIEIQLFNDNILLNGRVDYK